MQRIDQVCAHLGGPLSKQLLYALLARSLGVQRVGHLLRSRDVEGPALEALMPLQRRIEQVLLQHLLGVRRVRTDHSAGVGARGGGTAGARAAAWARGCRTCAW